MTLSFQYCCLGHLSHFQSGSTPCVQGLSPWQISHSSVILGSSIPSQFIFTDSYKGFSWPLALSGPSCRDCPDTHCLDSKTPNLGRRFCNFFPHVSFMTLRSETHGWHYQVQLPHWEGACLPWITFASAFICCCFLGIYKSLRFFLLKAEVFLGEVLPWGYPSFYSMADQALPWLSYLL